MFSALLTSLSSWGLAIALIFGPWAYGSTRPECVEILNWILFATSVPWVFGWVTGLRLPSVPLPLSIFSGLILLQGWWQVFNAYGFVDPVYFQFIPGLPYFPFLPGSMDRAVSLQAMVNISAMLLALIMSVDLAASRVLRLRLLATLMITGVCLSLFAFWILKTQAQVLSWPYGKSPFMFGPYRYHGNAGAFLNLVWPIAAAFSLHSFLRPASYGIRIFYAVCTLILFCAVAINASKGGQIVGASLFCAALVLLFFFRVRLFGKLGLRRTAMLAVIIAMLGAACLACMDLEQTEKRWNRFSERPVDLDRLGVAQICVAMIPPAGFFGFGPSTFRVMFPSYNLAFGKPVRWYWQEAHQDYLQTVIEWGYIGTLLWTLVVVGGFFRLVYALRMHSGTGASSRLVIPAGILLSLAGIFLHSMADYPLQVASLRLYTMVLLGMAWASPGWMDEKFRIRKRRRTSSSQDTESSEPAAESIRPD